MNTNTLHNFLKWNDTTLYCVFKPFVNAYKFYTKYKLFNYYLFRTDCLKDNIEKGDYYCFYDNKNCIVNGKINYKNTNVKKYVKENRQLYIGNTYNEKYGFCPIFLTCKINEHLPNLPNDEIYFMISGYTIDTKSGPYDFYFDKSTTKKFNEISENNMMLSILYASKDLKTHLDNMCVKTMNHLNEVGCENV